MHICYNGAARAATSDEARRARRRHEHDEAASHGGRPGADRGPAGAVRLGERVTGRQGAAAPPGATTSLLAMPSTATNWEGISETASGCGCLPPDPNGDIGLNDYVQTVNAAFEIWSRSGTVHYGPAKIDTLWNGFGGL